MEDRARQYLAGAMKNIIAGTRSSVGPSGPKPSFGATKPSLAAAAWVAPKAFLTPNRLCAFRHYLRLPAQFIRPSELAAALRSADLELEDVVGIAYNPLSRRASLTKNVQINYLACAGKPG